MANQYNEDSIQKMDPLTFTRHRPDSYLGSNQDSTQLAMEIITNCIDEHLIGNCYEIKVDYNKDTNVMIIADAGQGIIPNLWKGDKTVLQMVYDEINSSGKFDKSDDAVYNVSTGAFGIGAALTNFLSHKLLVTTRRNGEYETVLFNEGVFSKRNSGKCDKSFHGVEVKYQPNENFFVDEKINENKFKKTLENICCICPKLKVIYNNNDISHPNGIADLLELQLDKSVELLNSRCIFDIEKERQKLNLAITWSGDSNTSIIPFCNYGLIEAGTQITAIKSCITKTLNKWAREQNLLKDKENLSGSSLQEGMILVFNMVSPNIRYDSQTKVRSTNTDDNPFINEVLSKEFEKWLDNNPDDATNIIEKALIARKAAEAAKKARAAVKNKATKKEKVFKLPTTLTDAWSKDRSKCELLVCEGKSAASGLVAARDSEFQAVYGVRGKMLSVLKTTPEKILANVEINNLIQALGLDCDQKTAKLTYDKKKLRYGKIIACADADPDGQAIENLLFNILWYLCPDLIIEGHVYSAVPPLYRITTKNNEYIYLKDDNELEQYKKDNPNKSYQIGRNKGLGEQDSEELGECLLEPKTRNVLQLTVNDIGMADNLFEDLYGKKVEPRVKFLLEHSEEAHIE